MFRNGKCVPFFKTTSNLRYVLLLSTTIQTKKEDPLWYSNQTMVQLFRDWITSLLAKETQHKPSIEIGTFFTVEHRSRNVDTDGQSIIETKMSVYLDFLITSSVARLDTELTLSEMSTEVTFYSELFNITFRPLSYETVKELLRLESNKINNTDCFESDANKTKQIYRPVLVSKLMICEFVIFSSEEYILDQDDLRLTIIEFELNLYVPEFEVFCNRSVAVCFDKVRQYLYPVQKSVETALTLVTSICLISSECFLFITFLTYILFPKLRTLPGQINMSLVFCLICAQLCTIFLARINRNSMLCILIGLFSHFFWLCVFMWFNTCSFHIYVQFGQKDIQKPTVGSSKIFHKRYAFYSLYSFGMSSTLVISNILVSLVTSEMVSYGYGKPHCFIVDRTLFVVTLLVPLILVCTSNVFFFAVTAWRITKIPEVRKSGSDRSDFLICVKLFTLTGLTWVLQVFDSFLGVSVLTYIATVCNGLQGLFIFLSYVCNQRVLDMYRGIIFSRTKSDA